MLHLHAYEATAIVLSPNQSHTAWRAPPKRRWILLFATAALFYLLAATGAIAQGAA